MPSQRIPKWRASHESSGSVILVCAADDLEEAVESCFRSAERGDSKLSPDVLSVPGMTSLRIRHLLNRMGELPGCRFLEIGTLFGATALAASFDNGGTFLSVDNFSEFNQPDPRPALHQHLERFRDRCRVDFRETDCWELPSVLDPNSVNVYFFDGPQTQLAQRDALVRFATVLMSPFVLVVDDWNLSCVRDGTREALDELGWSVKRGWCRRTDYNGDAESWWNGLYVAVVETQKPSV